MEKIKSILQLIRWPNLVIMALTLVLMRYCVLYPILAVNGLSLEMETYLFVLLVFAVIVIAAAGYMINDYMDVDTDTINKPENVLVGRVFKPELIFNIYIALNIVALIAALFVAYKARFYSLFILFPITMGALWFYSNTYKRQFLIGNLIVSLLTALVPLLPAFFEIPFVVFKYKSILIAEGMSLKYLYMWTGIFALFAFLTNLLREIVKDAEDFAGDLYTGCVTLPVVMGLKATRIVIFSLAFLLKAILVLVYIYFLLFNGNLKIDFFSMGYFLVFLIIPIILIEIWAFKGNEKKWFSKSSAMLKGVMVAGILYAIVLRYKII